jgi:hypothetical protein
MFNAHGQRQLDNETKICFRCGRLGVSFRARVEVRPSWCVTALRPSVSLVLATTTSARPGQSRRWCHGAGRCSTESGSVRVMGADKTRTRHEPFDAGSTAALPTAMWQRTWFPIPPSHTGPLHFYYQRHSFEYRSSGCPYKNTAEKRRNHTSLSKTDIFACVACQATVPAWRHIAKKMKLPLPCSSLTLSDSWVPWFLSLLRWAPPVSFVSHLYHLKQGTEGRWPSGLRFHRSAASPVASCGSWSTPVPVPHP